MRIESFHAPSSYAPGGPTFQASSGHDAVLRSQADDVRQTRFEDLPSNRLEDLSEAVETARQRLEKAGLNIRLITGEGKDRFQVEVFNPTTKEVIRRFPPDEIIKLAESIEEMNGLVVNRTL